MRSSRFSFVAPATLAALSALAVVAAPAAHAQANLVFSGANGTPLTLTLTAPVTYTITAPITGSNAIPFFVFKNAFPGSNFNSIASGSLSYSVNGGAAVTFNDLQSNYNQGDIATGDLIAFRFSSAQPVATGDTVTLLSGTLTTSSNISTATPASGSFTTFVGSNANGARVSSNGISASAAPEPGSLTLLGMGLAGGLGMVGNARRRKAARVVVSA